jgi:hypothetical protein
VSTLQNNAISLSIAKNSVRRFKSGGLSCGNEERPARPLTSLCPAFLFILKKFSSASARVMAGNFAVDRATIKSILDRELGLKKFTCRWVPHMLSAEQRLGTVTESQSLLTILANLLAEKNVQGIIIEDKSWFAYLIESDAIFASSPAEVTARV